MRSAIIQSPLKLQKRKEGFQRSPRKAAHSIDGRAKLTGFGGVESIIPETMAKPMIGEFSEEHLIRVAKDLAQKKTEGYKLFDSRAESRIPKFDETGTFMFLACSYVMMTSRLGF